MATKKRKRRVAYDPWLHAGKYSACLMGTEIGETFWLFRCGKDWYIEPTNPKTTLIRITNLVSRRSGRGRNLMRVFTVTK